MRVDAPASNETETDIDVGSSGFLAHGTNSAESEATLVILGLSFDYDDYFSQESDDTIIELSPSENQSTFTKLTKIVNTILLVERTIKRKKSKFGKSYDILVSSYESGSQLDPPSLRLPLQCQSRTYTKCSDAKAMQAECCTNLGRQLQRSCMSPFANQLHRSLQKYFEQQT